MSKPAKLEKEIILYRDKYAATATTGFFKKTDGTNICRSLELPWNNNARDDKKTAVKESSCIPEGRYRCTRFFSPHFKYEVILLHDVPGRSMVEIHLGNTVDDVDGCIMPGQKFSRNFSYRGKVYDYFLIDSKTNLQKLKDLTEKEFWLTVTSAETLCKMNSTKGKIIS